MNWLTKSVLPKIKELVSKKDTKENLWMKCSGCNQLSFHRDLSDNLNICSNCKFHLPFYPNERLKNLFDEGKYEIVEYDLGYRDQLNFRDIKKYSERLKLAKSKSNADDAIVLAKGKIYGSPIVVAAFDFRFMGGSMGVSVGNAIVKASEISVNDNIPFLSIPSSGGARMQEGIISLMQMPRTIAAIQKISDSHLPHIVLLTHPTTGGVTASFAMLGDIHIAEPGATIGFAGRRVIEETVKEKLPGNFQTSDYLLEHGMIDIVADRHSHRKVISNIINIMMHKKNNFS